MIGLSLAVRNDRLQAVVERLDGAQDPGRLWLCVGIRPPTGGELAAPDDLLADIALARPPGIVADGVLTLTLPADTPALREGLPAWCRLCDGAAEPVVDGDVGIPGSGALIELEEDPENPGSVVRLYAGGLVVVLSAQLTEGNA